MRKTLVIALSLLAVFMLASCASTEKTETNSSITLSEMPEWVTSQASLQTEDKHYAVGYGHMSTFRNSLMQAQADGRNQLAIWVNIGIDNIITSYSNDAGVSESSNRQAMDAFETISKQRAQAMLSGITQEDMWQDPEGGVYVLLSLTSDGIITSLEEVNEEAFEKNEAAEEANSMMHEALQRYFGSPSITD